MGFFESLFSSTKGILDGGRETLQPDRQSSFTAPTQTTTPSTRFSPTPLQARPTVVPRSSGSLLTNFRSKREIAQQQSRVNLQQITQGANAILSQGKATPAQELLGYLPKGAQKFAETHINIGKDALFGNQKDKAFVRRLEKRGVPIGLLASIQTEGLLPFLGRNSTEQIERLADSLEQDGVDSTRATELAFYEIFSRGSSFEGRQKRSDAEAKLEELKPTAGEKFRFVKQKAAHVAGSALDVAGITPVGLTSRVGTQLTRGSFNQKSITAVEDFIDIARGVSSKTPSEKNNIKAFIQKIADENNLASSAKGDNALANEFEIILQTSGVDKKASLADPTNFKSADEFIKAQGETTYRGASVKEWEDVKKTGNFADKEGTILIDKKTGKPIQYDDAGKNTTTSKELADGYARESSKEGVTIEFKPEAKAKMRFSAKFESTDLQADEFLGNGLDINDVARVTDKNGKVIYEAGDLGKTKSQLTDIWNKANKPTNQKLADFKSGKPNPQSGKIANPFVEGKKDVSSVNDSTKLAPIDRLIAENKVRVVSRDGTDVYQVKKGDVWKNTRGEDSAIKQAGGLPVVTSAPKKLSAEGIPLSTRVLESKLPEPAVVKAQSPLKSVVQPKKVPPVPPARVSTLEEAARPTIDQMNLPPASRPKPLIEIVTQTPVVNKVNLIDLIRTPNRVLEKIGFGKEAALLRTQYDKYAIELPENIDRITEWTKRVPKDSSEKIFKYLDGKPVDLTPEQKKVGDEIREYLKTWADRLDLPDDNRVTNYITHLFDDQLIKKEFDEDLAKLITDKIPGEVYNPFLQKRLGAKGYIQDVWQALDAYTKRATRKVHIDPALEKIKDKAGSSLEFTNLEKSQFKYIQNYIDRVQMRPTQVDEWVDNTVKSVVGYKFGQRPVTNVSRALRQLTYRGMLGGNLSSAIRNLSQGINTYAVLGEKYTVIGYTKLLQPASMAELKASGVLGNNFIEDRVLSSTKTMLKNIDKALWFFFDSAEKVNRGAAYFGAKSKGLNQGMSEAAAMDYAKSIVRKTQFAYDAVDQPAFFGSDIMKTFGQFQTFTTKQTEFLAEMVKDKNAIGLLRYAIGGTAFVYTIGQAMGMKPEELIPIYRFDTPPSLKLPVEIVKAVADTPDKFGNKRTTEEKLKDIGKGGIGLFPGGSQIKKTVQGSETVEEGGSFDKAGRLQFLQGQSTPEKIQSVLFGKYASDESAEFFNKKETNEKAIKAIKPTYEEVQSLNKSGSPEAAQAIVDGLSEAEYAAYKGYKSKVKSEETVELKKEITPTYLNVQKLNSEGKKEEAQAIVDGLSDEEYEVYQKVKKDVNKLKEAEKERSTVELVGAYAKAFLTDPKNASKGLFTREKLGRVEGNLVELKRFYGEDFRAVEGSEAYIFEELKKLNIPQSERSNYNLEHIVPVSAGGDSSPENLKVVDRETHNSYTKFDIALGNAVKDKTLTRKEAEKIAKDYKNGGISEDEAFSQLNVIIK